MDTEAIIGFCCLLSVAQALTRLSWSPWTHTGKCIRDCSEPQGRIRLTRQVVSCQICSDDVSENCTTPDPVDRCHSTEEKHLKCYDSENCEVSGYWQRLGAALP
jgi:hypothetical protein